MYIEIDKNKCVLGHSDQGSANSIQTDKSIPKVTDIQILKFENGDFVVEDSQELVDKKAKYVAQEYARNRAKEYPAITDQLDEIYHNGIDSWKAVIKVTKDKYPKG
tara:strand:+ start:3466 stop:3783 length:318 start_codon:yes stop_codon:yes gene_type:complete